jgi:hypothetical protein
MRPRAACREKSGAVRVSTESAPAAAPAASRSAGGSVKRGGFCPKARARVAKSARQDTFSLPSR